MKPVSHLAGWCLVLLLTLSPMTAIAGGRNASVYEGQLAFGAQLLDRDEGCLFVDGSVTAGDFFQDLKRVDIKGQFEYRKHGRVVTEYPDSLTTSIRVVGNQCGSASEIARSRIFQGGSYTLKFAVAWKDELTLSPAVLVPGSARCTGINSVTIPDRGFNIPSVTCQLRIESKGVPLSDHLIVSVFAPEGTPITRLSAAP
jgi:hypothetical protein